MKKSAFEKIQREYVLGVMRLEKIKPGDLVWDRDFGGSYCPVVVEKVDVDKDYVRTVGVGSDHTRRDLTDFLTESEMLKEGFEKEMLAQEYVKYAPDIKKVLERK